MSSALQPTGNWRRRGMLLAPWIALLCGCVTTSHEAVPANRLPPELLAKPRSACLPIDLTLLRQTPPPAHMIGPFDVLGVYIQDVVSPEKDKLEPGMANIPVVSSQDYYPPRGLINSPVVGSPREVASNGTLSLPLIPPLHVDGLTLAEATEKIRRAYTVERRILEPGRERILLTLIRPRVQRIVVIRDDVASGPTFQPQGHAALLTRRGTGQVLDLPAYEDDVMHALAATGGLPGVDAYSGVWIFRERLMPNVAEAIQGRIQGGEKPEDAVRAAKMERSSIHIPLRMAPCESLPFGPEDVKLQTGDVVYLESRQSEYFFSGGLLPGGQIPLPRDYDLDVIGALALATGSAGGPPGGPDSGALNFRGAGNPGNIVAPSRVLVSRKLDTGELIEIRVDVKRAMHDARERLQIAPGDVVSLKYTPGEIASNFALNLVTFNFMAIINRN